MKGTLGQEQSPRWGVSDDNATQLLQNESQMIDQGPEKENLTATTWGNVWDREINEYGVFWVPFLFPSCHSYLHFRGPLDPIHVNLFLLIAF